MFQETTLKNKIEDLFDKNRDKIFANDPKQVRDIRQESFKDFLKLDFPSTKLESWKNTDLKKILERDYSFYFTIIIRHYFC